MRVRPFLDAVILIIDQDEERIRQLVRLLRSAGYDNLRAIIDPRDAACAYLRCRADLVIAHLPCEGMDRYEVLDRLHEAIDSEDYVPILAVTEEGNREVRERALALGARDFVAKPFSITEVTLRVANLLHARRLHLQLLEQNRMLDDLVTERTSELEVAQLELLEHLATAAEYRDDATGAHTRRVADLTKSIALELGLPEDEAETLGRASLLHDIGKIGVPDRILHKPSRLTYDEYTEVKRHTDIGATILSGSRSHLLQLAESIALTHHERWDGNGYMGLRGEAIPLEGRIVAVADVFDALISERTYKRAWPVQDAIAEVVRNSGSQFDPRVVSAFMHVVADARAAEPVELRIVA